MGVEYPMSNSGEIRNAKRTIPLGIFFGISAVLIIYIAIQVVSQGVLGNTLVSHKDSPLGAVAEIIVGKSGIIFMIIAISISMIGTLSGSIFSTPRVLYAGAQDSLMPKVFAKVHLKYFTPHVAILFYSALGLLFASIGGFKQLAIISGASSLLIYLGVVLATIKLRKRDSQTLEKTFQIPGGIIVPLLAIGVILWLLSNLSIQEIIGLNVFIVVFSLIYISTKFLKKIHDFNTPKG